MTKDQDYQKNDLDLMNCWKTEEMDGILTKPNQTKPNIKKRNAEAMIRYAVGGIIKSDDTILLVKKGKVMDTEKSMEVKPEWDFPKGGIKREDLDIQEALFRELDEETGTRDFRVIGELGTLEFEFPAAMKVKLHFERQVTHMFLLEFLGDRAQLKPKTEEISEVVFVKIDEVDEHLKLTETKAFFQDNLDGIKSGIVLR